MEVSFQRQFYPCTVHTSATVHLPVSLGITSAARAGSSTTLLSSPSSPRAGIESEEKFTYFFTERARKHENGSKTDRVTRDGKGHWKLTSTLTKVFAESGSYLGKKNTLVYYVKNLGDQKDIKTNWIMHEFVIAKCLVSASSSFAQPEDEHYDDLVTCRIYEKESYNNLERSKEHRNLIDYLIGPNPNTIQPPLQPSPEVINEVKLEEDILDLGDPNGGDLQDILSVSPPYESFGDYLKSLGI